MTRHLSYGSGILNGQVNRLFSVLTAREQSVIKNNMLSFSGGSIGKKSKK
jgi:hypothetical protein